MGLPGRRLAAIGFVFFFAAILAGSMVVAAARSHGDDSRQIARYVIAGRPSASVSEAVVEEVEPVVQMAGTSILPDVPAFEWSYGCASTSAAMLFGYYDRIGYQNMYVGPANGGLCPLDNTVWGDGINGSPGECPLSATHKGLDGLSTRGHVDDYWVSYGSTAADPYITYGWTEHVSADCAGDFMGTNQSGLGNVDGATAFYFFSNGDPLYDYNSDRDGCHGLRLFAESRGYIVEENFTQLIQGEGSDPSKGFTFADFMDEIDQGRPVLIHLDNHTVLGYGYSSTGSTVYIHDTYDLETHTMTWGGAYGSASQWGVSVIRLSPVITGEATQVAAHSVTLNGWLASLLGETSVVASFQYGTVPGAYTYSTSTRLLTSPGEFSIDVSGLSGATTYYYRARIISGETYYGSEEDFTTSALPPEVITDAVSSVTTSSATLKGRLTSLGTASEVEVYFEWGPSSGPYTSQTSPVSMTSGGTFSAELTGLNPGTSYHLRAVADGHGTDFGEEVTFTTKTLPPVVFTLEASGVSTDSGTLNGRLVSLGTAPFVDVFFEWGTAPGVYTQSSPPQTLDSTGYFTFDVGGYAPGTACYYRACAVGDGRSNGTEAYFITATERPAVSTTDVLELGTHTATLSGSLLSMGTAPSVIVSFQYGTMPGVYWFETPAQVMTHTGDWSTEIAGLSPGVTYYCRAKAFGHGTGYGDQEVTFTTLTLPPVIVSLDATDIGPHTAILHAQLSDLGTAQTVQVSIEYGTDTGVYTHETLPSVKAEAGAVGFSFVDLMPGATYYFRAKAVGHGTGYTEERTFTTATIAPLLGELRQTWSPGSTSPSARVTGQLVSLGTASSVLLSLELSTAPGGPYEVVATEVMTAPGTFDFELAELDPGRTYYCRVRADGGTHGLSYASEVTLSADTRSIDWVFVGSAIVGALLLVLLTLVFARAIMGGPGGRW